MTLRRWGFVLAWSGLSLDLVLTIGLLAMRLTDRLDDPPWRSVWGTVLWLLVALGGVILSYRRPMQGPLVIGFGVILAANAIVNGGYEGKIAPPDSEWMPGWLWVPGLVASVCGAVMIWPWNERKKEDGTTDEGQQI
jgi:hypothetical protein